MCPQCKQPVLVARIEGIQLYESDGGTLNGVKYSCMSCNSVLALGIDPLAQKNQIVNEIIAAFGKRPL
jgi:hypothetical protein